jgi:hypothetical protein
MAHYTNFRPFHQYNSYYPYYLPSYYSRFYPNSYDRYFEPTDYWLEKRQPIIEITEPKEQIKQKDWMLNIIIVMFVAILLFVMASK